MAEDFEDIDKTEDIEQEAELDAEPQPLSPEAEESGRITDRRTLLAGMYRNWYLEYASYVILERAVPHIEDGLKPVQRRILHSMQTLDDGRFNKVANVVGNTMQYHPHGDASIAEALVQLGQKELLVDTQGNWGNILTGDSHAAPRYIEARLSEFAIETVFSPKITEWTVSYDGRKPEPVTLPVKFPLLLAQGAQGIAVGLSSRILPHNFNEIIDAAVAYLEDRPFELYPDFQTGGLLDASRYNDGARGGSVKVRARIEKIDSKTLVITEVPYGTTTSSLIASIVAAKEKDKIKIRKVDDGTAATAEIFVHLAPGTSSDKAIDALYAFTDCEVSISPNCCVIRDKKPHFMGVSDVLRYSTDRTKELFYKELEIKLGETQESRLFTSLESIFIQERIYKDKELEQAPDMDAAIAHLEKRFEPYAETFFRPLTRDDLMKLWEIRMGRILKFNADKAQERIAALDAQIEQLRHDLEHITDYTKAWFLHLKEKYGDRFPRRTVIRGFDSIEATKVAEANKRLYFDRKGGFVGTSLRDDEFLFTCSDLDDLIIFYRDGRYKVIRVQDKVYIGPRVEHVGLFKKGDKRTVYNVIYRRGPSGPYYKKRFSVTGLTRDKEYDLTKGVPGSKIEYFSANPNGEAEVVGVRFAAQPDKRNRKLPIEEEEEKRRTSAPDMMVDFATLAIKGRDSLGNLVTKKEVKSISLAQEGVSTLGGRDVWFDRDVLRLNYDGRGEMLGNFQGTDRVLVISSNGRYYTTSFDESNHYNDNISRIEKFAPEKTWTLVLFDAEKGYPYLKRFRFEDVATEQSFVGANPDSRIILLTDTPFPRFRITFGGADAAREPMEIEAEDFVGVKSPNAKGKRLSTWEIAGIEELEPLKVPEEEPEEVEPEEAGEESESETDAPETSETAPHDPEESHLVQGELFGSEE